MKIRMFILSFFFAVLLSGCADVFSELDSSRQKKMYELLEGTQVLMTGTAFKFKPDEDFLTIGVKAAQLKPKMNIKTAK